jgi:putative DNA primase/helicase
MTQRPKPTVSEVERAFSDALQQAGFNPGRVEVGAGDFVRFDAPGDKPGKRNGFYKLAYGDYPVGWFGDWKRPEEQQEWRFFGADAGLTDAEKAKMRKEARRLKVEAEVQREEKQLEIAQEASAMWGRAVADVAGHQYLERKRISVPRALRLYSARDGVQLLAVPMYRFDVNGQPVLTNLQTIDPNGQKRFLKGGRVQDCFFSLKGSSDIIVICEGVATAFSVWAATGLSVVAAFNSGNLCNVVREFRRWRPQAVLLIAADNDEIAPDDWADKGGGKPWENAGVKAARKAAEDVGCRWIHPVFKGGARRDRTDFNDLFVIEGEDAVKQQVGAAFRRIEDEGTDSPEPAEALTFEVIQDETWRSNVPRMSSGNVDGGNVQGVALYIEHHKLLRTRLRFNSLTKDIEIDGNPMEDIHPGEFRRIMHAEGFKARKPDVQDEMTAEARRNQYDPLRQYLAALKWDGKERLETWLSVYLGTEDTRYTRTVGRKFLIGAAARALDPGCKLDTMLVIEGPQGAGKSTALRYLFGDQFFVDHLPDFHSKDSFQQLQGAWCVEVAELSALSKADVKDVKQFLSRLVDKFRPPYGTAPISVPRRCAFAGTVNPEDTGYLRDPTGARRFWPVLAGTIALGAILRDRDQIWAEAVRCFADGEKWYLTDDDEISDASEQQLARREQHPWEATIASWVKHGEAMPVTETTVSDVLTNAIKMPAEKQAPVHTRSAGAALRALGWKDKVVRRGSDKIPTRIFFAPGYHPDDARQKDLDIDAF